MNIEQLNKSQIVLLTLLVSFVTSIATGIVTVSLMDQAPPVVAQTVNRVIERTVETVAPSQTAATTVTRERTVVVKESELISQAVAQISPSVVRLYSNSSETGTFLGFGVVLSGDGVIVTDASALGDVTETSIGLSDGTRVKAVLTRSDKTTGAAFLQASTTDSKVTWKSAVVAGDSPLLGQSVVVLTGKSSMRVEDGIVTALLANGTDSPNSIVDTNISADSIALGSPLVNTDGEFVGVSTGVSRTSSTKGFIAASALLKKPEPATQDKAKTE